MDGDLYESCESLKADWPFLYVKVQLQLCVASRVISKVDLSICVSLYEVFKFS